MTGDMVEKKQKIIFIIVMVLIYLVRIIHLDQDLPPWGIGYYQPVDEGAYSLLALNYETYGNINPTEDDNLYITNTPLQTRTNVIGNFISIISLSIFGDNYYGYRMGYVFVGLVNFLLYIAIIKQIQGTDKNNKYGFSVMCFWLLTDFMFYMCTRTVENSSIRLLLNLVIVLVWTSGSVYCKWKYVIIGFLSVISVFGVYITNLFIFLAVFLAIIYLAAWEGVKKVIPLALYCVLGAGIGFVVLSFYYNLVWDSDIISSTFKIIQSFSNSYGYEISDISESGFGFTILQKFVAFWSSNSLLYNLPIVFIILSLLPFIIKKYFIQRDNKSVILYTIIFSFMLQTLFVEDCIGRKILTIYPIFLFVIFKLYIDRKLLFEFWNGLAEIKRLLYTYYLLFVLGFCAYLVYYRFYLAADNTYLDFDTETKWSIVLLVTSVVFFVYMFFTVLLNCSKTVSNFDSRKVDKMWLLMVLPLIAFNVSLILRFSIISPTYSERDAMKILDNYVSYEDVYVVGGGYQLSYSLYNDMKFLVANDVEDIVDWVESSDKILIIDYEISEENMSYFNDYLLKDSIYTVEPVCIIYRNFQAYGEVRNFCLYKRVLR